jgi:hypothetical protein
VDVTSAIGYPLEPSGLVTDALARFGSWVYAALFAIVSAETGLVAAPFLPGDSLLFVSGAIAGAGQINVWLASGALVVAAIAGDAAGGWEPVLPPISPGLCRLTLSRPATPTSRATGDGPCFLPGSSPLSAPLRPLSRACPVCR